MAEPNATNVIAGQTVLYVAAAATAPPSLAAKPSAATWAAAGFSAVGYTEAGVDFVVTPAVKDITPDETITPIKQIITGIKLEVKTKLLESHLENLQRVLPLSTLTNPGAGIKTLTIGSGGSLNEFVIGFQGPGVGGVDSRVIVVWRVNNVSSVSQGYQRKDVTMLDVTFSALTDSTKTTLQDVCEVVDFNAGS
jgi:hypothetical protein